MKDLAKGSIVGHIGALAPTIFLGIAMTLLCGVIDMYFVSRLGKAAIAGVGSAGNVGFLVNALTQVLSVGTVALISHAAGRKDRADANLVFNQSLGLSMICGVLTWIAGSALASSYMRSIAADDATVEAGTTYLLYLMPALALQFALLVMGSALRGTGVVRPTMIVQALTLVANLILAPVLINGFGTGRAFGVAGAGLATSLAVLLAVLVLVSYFYGSEHYVQIEPKQWRPQVVQWKRILSVGLPAGGEFAVMFAYMAIIYYALKAFGAEAQAGFGIGSRVLGMLQVPGMAIAFAAGAIAGQSFGARDAERVKKTFAEVAVLCTAVMVALTLLAQWTPEAMLSGFTTERETLTVGVLFLRMISLNLVAQGLLFVCSSMFQGLGNTKPVLVASLVRLATYGLPIMALSRGPGFRIEHIWYLSIAATTLQAALSLWLLRDEFRRRLLPLVE